MRTLTEKLAAEQYQLVLFDLDGTLVDTASDMFRSMNIALQKFGWPLVSEYQIRQWVGQGTSKLCDSVLLFLFGEINPTQHQQLLATYLEVYEKELCVASSVYAGVVNFLNYCQYHEIKMACVTNKPEGLAKKLLDQLKIRDYFKLVVGGDSLAERKPHPLPLLYSVEYFNEELAHTLMIGDSKHDIEAAKRAGIDCIVVSYGYNHGENIFDSQPQLVIDDLNQLVIA